VSAELVGGRGGRSTRFSRRSPCPGSDVRVPKAEREELVRMFSWAKKSAGQSGRSPASTSQRRRRRTPSMNVAWACRTVGVSASGWCAWRAAQVSPCRRRRDDAELRATIRQIHRQSRGTYGAPRVRAELRIGFGYPHRTQAGLSGSPSRWQARLSGASSTDDSTQFATAEPLPGRGPHDPVWAATGRRVRARGAA
jgi:hypothetical protein